MGRHKFENQFKDKLSQREIKPSAGSWEKLSGQLNSEEKKQKPAFWWIGIAATLLGAIFVAGLVYNNHTETDSPGLVETPVIIDIENNNEAFEENVLIAEENRVKLSTKDTETPSLLKDKASQPVKQEHEATVIAEAKKENLPVSSEKGIIHNDGEISKKLEEIIAEVSMKNGDRENPTNDELEALLYKAASEISLERNRVSSTRKVDARDLLFAVEMELEETFREKVFDILKESYLKARTAVANRNY